LMGGMSWVLVAQEREPYRRYTRAQRTVGFALRAT